MTELPEPLVPAEVDLQDFPFMPLQVARLRDSNLAAEEEPETCWYAVLLWAASWHQIPAGSLPDNDTVLMRLVGLGRDKRTWAKHRKGALRGFVLCSDGRLYHPVVAESALEAWNGKLRQRHAKFCAAVRKHNQRHEQNQLVSPTFEEWETLGRPERVTETVTELSRVTGENDPRDMGSKGQGEGQGEGQGDSNEEPDGSSTARKRARNGTRLSPDWVPSDLPPNVAALVAQWPPGRIDRELDNFRDYWTSRSRDAAKIDWDKTWHNRIRDIHDRVLRDNRNGRPASNGADRRDGVARAIDRRLGFDDPPGEAERRDAGDGGGGGEDLPRLAALR